MSPIQINISDHDEEYSRLPRWGLAFYNGFTHYHSSTAHLQLEWSTRTDGKWGGRANLQRNIQLDLTSKEVESLIHSTFAIPEVYHEEIIDHTEVHTHGGHSPTRSNNDCAICRSITFLLAGECTTIYIRKDSHVWSSTEWGQVIARLLLPHYLERPWLAEQSNRKLP